MKLYDWLDRNEIVSRLVASGMRHTAAEAASPLFGCAAAALEAAGVERGAEVVGCWAPGRIEVLGKHTDYCGGSSLLAAAERGFAMIAAPRDDNVVRLIDAGRGESADFAMGESIESLDGHWSNYPRTVARRMTRNFPAAKRGSLIALASNLPPSAGMSSSSALVVGTFLLLAQVNELFQDGLFQSCIENHERLAGYLGTVENGSSFGRLAGDRGVGTFGGSEDHTAILCGQPGKLVQYAYCPVRLERAISLDDRYVFAVAASGVIAEKTGAARDQYNRLSLLVKAIVEQWYRAVGGQAHFAPRTTQNEPVPGGSLAAILASAPGAGDLLRRALRNTTHGTFSSGELLDRLEQFEVEQRLIQSLPTRLDPSTVGDFGGLVGRSQDAAERLLANQTPETVHLVESAVRIGAHAASAFGAGFGGSVWAMIDAADELRFLTRWQEEYAKRFSDRMSQAAFFASRPGPPAQVWCGEAGRQV
jgi:galactokinase